MPAIRRFVTHKLGLIILALSASVAQAGPNGFGYEDHSARVGRGQPAAPAAVPLVPGVSVIGPYQRTIDGAYVSVPHYRGPDGLADDLIDVSRDINGIPCGVYCQARALRRWGYAPAF